MERGVYRFAPGESDNGLRLDQYLPAFCAPLSRTLARKLIDFGGVHVNGKRVRTCSLLVRSGDTVELYYDALPLEPFALSSDTIIFQDKHILVLDKPAGIDCQPTPSRFKGTIYAALLEWLVNPRQPRQKPPIGMVQRLDRDTSGVLIFSIHPNAHQGLTRQFTQRTVNKTYLALVAGRMLDAAGEFRSFLAKNRATNLMRSVEKGGQEAITRYRTLIAGEDASLVEVDLLTGRSHQIRVHFSEAGHPLLGDVRYGGSATWRGHTIARQMLHAARLALQHPVTGQVLDFEARVPADMAALIHSLQQENP